MTRTFILLCTGVFAIAYALYELKHMGVYYPDASNPQLFTGWKAVTELGPAILATGIAATAFSLWLFILFFRSSESRRIQSETDRYQQALREAEEAHAARQNALIRDHNMKTETLHSHYCDAANVLREEYGVSLDIENYCTLRLFFDLSTLAGLSRRNLPEAGIRLLFQI